MGYGVWGPLLREGATGFWIEDFFDRRANFWSGAYAPGWGETAAPIPELGVFLLIVLGIA